MTARFGLGRARQVVELATNDGTLLAEFAARGCRCLGVEPATVPAQAARARGLRVVEAFFDSELAGTLCSDSGGADLVVANNVLGHVPDPVGFCRGVALLLRRHGVATFEFPYLPSLVAGNQFDTIYHEHHSYFSLTSATRVLSQGGLRVFDAERLPVHGGSLRLYADCQAGTGQPVADRLRRLQAGEDAGGVRDPAWYGRLQPAAERVRCELVEFLRQALVRGWAVGGYGAAAKGTTLLNWAGVTRETLPWVVDRNPIKQGRLLPGCRIPVTGEGTLAATPPDYLLILPWNLRDEVIAQLRRSGLANPIPVTAIPEVTIG
jgi:SAM-dependent methyltransferase